MVTDCTDVCNAVIDRLEAVGFDFSEEQLSDETDCEIGEIVHDKVLDALSQVRFVLGE